MSSSNVWLRQQSSHHKARRVATSLNPVNNDLIGQVRKRKKDIQLISLITSSS
jgi:hypothetical protein